MSSEKKISSKEVGLEIGLVLSKFFFKTEHLHFGFWPLDLKVSIENFKKSQDFHSEKIINSIPSGVETILDVGSGSGGLAKKLVENGYKVECVSPSDYLSEAIEKKLKKNVKVHRSTFESLEVKKTYDLVLFSESFQYVNIEKTLNKIPGLSNKNGHLLICDFLQNCKWSDLAGCGSFCAVRKIPENTSSSTLSGHLSRHRAIYVDCGCARHELA